MATIDVLARIEGSIQDGGWKASGAVLNDADRLAFYKEFLVWYEAYLGSGWDGPRLGFDGHIIPDPWTKTFQSSEMPWTSIGAQEFLKQGEIQGIFYKHVASAPDNRHQIIDMNYAKIIYEMISGHCNLMWFQEAATYDDQLWDGGFNSVTHLEGFLFLDLDTTNSSAVNVYQLKAGNFWQRLQDIANIEFFLLYVDKVNRLHYVPHPMFGTLPTAVFTITSSHLAEPLTFEQRNTETVGQVKLFGTTPQGLQISGKYPTNPTAGPIAQRTNYMATSSTLMNTIATRMYKFENRDYTVTAKIPSGVGLMLELLDRVSVTYTSSADGIAFSAKKFWIHKITVEIMQDFSAMTTLVLESENA